MNSFNDLFEKIRKLENELRKEMGKKSKELFYEIKNRKIIFDKKTKKMHKKLARNPVLYILKANWRVLLVTPIIYVCLIPIAFLDIIITLYQFICFGAYKIPKVKRADYFHYDRKYLSYLNIIEKVHCVYCSYFNGVIAYAREIGARTEQRWCPIKHSIIIEGTHSRYHKFFDYADAEKYRKEIEILNKEFDDLKSPKDDKSI